MNQISSRFSYLCRSSSSLLRNDPFAKSLKPIFSASSNLVKELHQHTFNYPSPAPQIPRNHHFRKLSGEASECGFQDDDYIENEISKLQIEQGNFLWSVADEFVDETGLDRVEDLANKFNALMKKLGLATLDDSEKEGADYDDYPHHLQRFRKEIQDLVQSFDMTVAYGEFMAAGGDRRWHHFESNYRCMLKYYQILASLRQMNIRSRLMRRLIGYPSPPKLSERVAESNFCDDENLKKEIRKVQRAKWKAQDDLDLGNGPLSDSVKAFAEKFNALMENLGRKTLDDEKHSDVDDEYPDHLKRFRDDIEFLENYADMIVAFGEYVAAGGDHCWLKFMGNYRCMIDYEEIIASLRQMKIRSRLMRRLITADSDSQSTVA